MKAVYIIAAEGGPVKIGVASNPRGRLAQLRTGTPFPLTLAHVEDIGDLNAYSVERKAHAGLRAARVHGEWFSASVEDAKRAVSDAIERLRNPLPPMRPLQHPEVVLRDPMRPEQCRAARALLNWSQGKLADKAKVARATLAEFEGAGELLMSGPCSIYRGPLRRPASSSQMATSRA